MAFQLAPRTSSVCSQSPYSKFLPLQGFAPAVTFCTAFEVNYKLPTTSTCPTGNSLCTVLSSLSSCELTVISQACICIGVTPASTTISVPKSTASSTSPGKTTSQSSLVKSSATTWATPTSSWTSVKSSSSTWATSTTATNTCPASCGTVTVTVTPSTCQPAAIVSTTTSAAACTPTCMDGAQPVCPPPAGAICQQNGTISPTNWDLITDGSAISVSDCAAQCLGSTGCLVSEYDYLTQDCQLFNGGNATQLGFVPVAASPFIVSDVGCFVVC